MTASSYNEAVIEQSRDLASKGTWRSAKAVLYIVSASLQLTAGFGSSKHRHYHRCLLLCRLIQKAKACCKSFQIDNYHKRKIRCGSASLCGRLQTEVT